ncbi:PIN domain-containing protein [Micromonospora ureilytica]
MRRHQAPPRPRRDRACVRDPVDRMLVAQALHEGLTLVTRDDRIQKYDVPTPPGTLHPTPCR